MRLVFLILLLLNVMYFGWQHYLPAGNSEDNFISSDPGLEKLVLLHEIKQSSSKRIEKKQQALISAPVTTPEPVQEQKKEQEAIQLAEKELEPIPEQIPGPVPVPDQIDEGVEGMEEPEEVGQPVQEVVLACYEVGPYQSEGKARQALEQIEHDVKQVEIETRTRKISKYWVFLSPQKSLNVAKQIVNQLASKGVKDYQIVTIAGKKNGISLGLFREQKIAELRVKSIEKLGYEPEVSAINKEASEYWLEVIIDQADNRQKEKLNIIPSEIVSQTSCSR